MHRFEHHGNRRHTSRKTSTRWVWRLLLPSLLVSEPVAATSTEQTRLHHYTVLTDEALTRIQVRACFSGTPARGLMAESLDAATVLERASVIVAGGTGWRAHELFGKLDVLTGTTVSAELYDQHVRPARIPDPTELRPRLGITLDAQGQIVLSDEASERAYRDAIVGARAIPAPYENAH